ncbi:MAG TPA: histidinol dehydrogenase, partial [Gillisia sp.]|nr:histidinol dehydrogenase [Gillisia sp.]
MQKIINPQRKDWDLILQRPTQTVEDIESTVNEVFSEIKKKGDQAISKYTSLFDGVNLENLEVAQSEINDAEKDIAGDLKEAIILAHGNITRFHTAQRTEKISVTTTPGVECWQEKRPIEKVGLYIPGGTAPLFSTILMLAIPA